MPALVGKTTHGSRPFDAGGSPRRIGGISGLTRTASLELGERGIRVNAVMPGLIDTPLMATASPAFADAAIAEVPLGRMGVPADIAPTIAFLVSDDSALLQRRRDRHRRRPDRARLPQGHRRRDRPPHEARQLSLGGAVRRGGGRGRPRLPVAARLSVADWSSRASSGRSTRAPRRARAAGPARRGDPALPYKPPSIRDFVTFESHVEGVRKSIDHAEGVPEAWYDAPTFYFTNPHALYGPGEAIPRPATSRALDFEMEVAVVLGRGGRDPAEAEAKDAIFGYTIFNDWSARDIQSREMQTGLGPAKGKDFASTIGPWIVTADELEDHHDADGFLDLDCRVSVNGQPIGHDRLCNMHWTFAQMIAYASRDSVVLAGDLLASGTTGGGGCLAELWGRNGEQTPPPLEPGDEVSISVEALGVLDGSVA